MTTLVLVVFLAGPPPRPDFRRDVAPLLARTCVACHGPDKQRGGLRLDHGPSALAGGDSGQAIRPGDLNSILLQRVMATEDRMPPGKGKALKADEIALLRAWIAQGATWPEDGPARTTKVAHWSFQPVTHPTVPVLGPSFKGVRPRLAANPVDAFILYRLAKEKLAPSPEADRTTLLRRLSLDLVGLPPTPAESDAFLTDNRPGAYERQVDRLLASPAFGERWARHWLDAARYADSDGYEKDGPRPNAWRYRQWVIDALNSNMPHDRFIVEQMAGDLVPGATDTTRTATGFHRQTLTNREGGADREQFRVEAVMDRVGTTARTFLGLTLSCAQCHDHKYDPLSQREFYRFFAFFDSDAEKDIPAPTLVLGKERRTRILLKGDFLRPGIEVQPGTPASLPAMNNKGRATRLDLGRWLASNDNPLTPRVAVNSAWLRLFGRGLVSTPEDFGTQGEKPSHPELLDWLAGEFVRSGWDTKGLLRLIVTSQTYRQTSASRDDLHDRDPLNVLVARQARLRLEAETIRDAMLSVSGLLAPRLGGPSVRPPQPAGISELTYAGSAKWVESKGDDRYRRGLYTWFQRTSPYPLLATFDAPDGVLCCVKRERSNTPLQALTLLNDTVFVECASALAQRVSRESTSTEAKLRLAFRLATSRQPTTGETARLAQLHSELAALSAADPKGAAALGGSPEAAVWIMLARTVLNLDETVMRE